MSESLTFISSVKTGKITASDLVQSAIAQGRLNSDAINDTEYLNNVQSYLDSLDND